MPHIRIESLAARGAEDDLGKHKKAFQPVVQHEVQSIPGVQGLEHLRGLRQGHQARCGQNREPQGHDRPEHSRQRAAAPPLQGKQNQGDAQGNAHQHAARQTLQAGNDGQPLYGGEDADGRGDDPVAHKQ